MSRLTIPLTGTIRILACGMGVWRPPVAVHQRGSMKIVSYTKGKYLVLRIHPHGEDFPDLSELKDLILNYLDKGVRHIAVNFVDTSYIYSGELRVLITCYRIVEERGGNLCIVEPNPTVFDILKILNIDKIIRIYGSEDCLE